MSLFDTATDIYLSEVPEYLVGSELHRNFCSSDEDGDVDASADVVGRISVPAECMKLDAMVNNIEDLRYLLRTLRYWVSSLLPEELIKFCIGKTCAVEALEVLEEFSSELDQLQPLVKVLRVGRDIPSMMVGAAGQGVLSILRCLHQSASRDAVNPWSFGIFEAAAEGGHVECLKYAHEQGCPWNQNTCRNAALGGHLECLKYAHEQGCPWDQYTVSGASEDGHLECLKYAHEQGCPWDQGTCNYAAAGGHLECLKYAHEQGCPWDQGT